MNKKLNCVLMSFTPDPEGVVAASAKLCYSKEDAASLMENMTQEKIESFILKLKDLNHESPFEHVSFTFSVEGVSRVLTHQLVRHRIASYSQRSQRYVSESDADFILPPSIERNPMAYSEYMRFMDLVTTHYNRLVELGVPKEDARYVLSNATETKIVITMNARSLFNLFHHRCCQRAQWEIRELANQMLKQVKTVAPRMFKNAGPHCVLGYCPENNMSCGKVPTLNQLIESYNNKKV